MHKKILASLVVCIMALQLAACGGASTPAETTASQSTAASEPASAPAETEAPEVTGTHTVVDHGGNTIQVPNKISRVVIDQIPILSTYMAYFGGDAPNIVGFCGSFKDIISKTVLKDIAPELLASADTVYAQSDLNIEEIMKLEPDVIFYNAQNAQHAEILQASGIPCVGFATVGASTPADPINRYQEWLTLLEAVFGETGKTAEFQAAGNAIVADVESRIAAIPAENRPTGLILWKYANGTPMVSGNGTFGTFWLQRLGVTDLAVESTGFAQTNMEQLLSWNPDILYLDGPGLLNLKTADVLENKVEGADFSSLDAVKTGRVYDSTLGMWNWFTPNPDAPLVYAWLACMTYPEAFADYPLEETIRDYYAQWYGYTVTDADMAEMLSY